MAKKKQQVDFPFYSYLQLFYQNNKGRIRQHYRVLTKKFLDYNNPENTNAYLRQPQFEALEMYIFLKEFLNNRYLYQVFEDWYKREGGFENRADLGIHQKTKQVVLFGPVEANLEEDQAMFQRVFEQIKSFQQIYPNYIFALTMGLGKTILMATSIFYEFLLANKFPNDEKYCHNALVFAPDKTVLQSLKEIQTFDKSKVVPEPYVNWLDTHLKFFFLDKTGDALNAIENSKFNIIVSNTQKIILKKSHKKPSDAQLLFKNMDATYKAISLNKEYEDLYGFDIDTDTDLITNQRFAKLTRLKQLGIYVDEAHHAFGSTLAKDFGLQKSATSLRVTINELAENLKKAGSQVVGCYNYTGTPYVKNKLLPEVVYAYGLKAAIDNQYLKQIKISGFTNVKDQTAAFAKEVIAEFWETHKGQRYEGMLPKMAFFASNMEELQTELRPAVEEALSELNIPISSVLVNVGDPKITSNDDLREFKRLDSPASQKQFILLVNKGKEGWNCRSLFAVGLHRKPKSKIFVLQATMRCLRQIGEVQHTGRVFLSDENIKILEDELQSNFKLSIDDLNASGDEKETVEIRVVPPPVTVKLKRIKKLFNIQEKEVREGIDLEFENIDVEKYKILRSERNIHNISERISNEEDVSHIKEQREFSELTIVAEVARYLNASPIKIRKVLSSTKQGMDEILSKVNEYNELLYDWIIPKLFPEFYDIEEFEKIFEEEVELVKKPKARKYAPQSTISTIPDDEGTGYSSTLTTPTALDIDFSGFYTLKSKSELIIRKDDEEIKDYLGKSFHVDAYCFDSEPEKKLFLELLKNPNIENVWFTGMLTHGQSDFKVPYIDPESHTLRSYYPDFLVQKKDGNYVIIEVKADFQVDDPVVLAKQAYTEKMAEASAMTYRMIKGSDIMKGVEMEL